MSCYHYLPVPFIWQSVKKIACLPYRTWMQTNLRLIHEEEVRPVLVYSQHFFGAASKRPSTEPLIHEQLECRPEECPPSTTSLAAHFTQMTTLRSHSKYRSIREEAIGRASCRA